jgi:SAM-dependent methyltransferase
MINFHKRLIDALTAGDVVALRMFFDDTGDTLYGLDSKIMQYWGKTITTDYFAGLARRIGVVPVRHPLNPSPDENWNPKDGVELKKKIEDVVGPIIVPNGFNGTDTTNGIPYSYFSRVAEWYTIQCLIDPRPKRVLEIGAGTGGLALEAFRNGVRDYTIIDIPSVAVMSAYFASLALGEDNIWLAGEPPNPNAIGKWFSCYDYDAAVRKYDLIMNVNSFPEMSIENQDGYMKFIHECLAGGGMFYSCNHESNSVGQNIVRLAINRHGGFKTIYRAPFMMRDGYMEEIYKVV